MAKPSDRDDSANLMILGVIHRDQDAAPLLARWLGTWRPAAVTLEFSQYGLKYREAEGQALKERVLTVIDDMTSRGLHVDRRSLDTVLAFLEPSFEFVVASEYAARYGCPLYLIDDDRFSRLRLAAVEELISKENLEKLLSGPPHNDCRYQKMLASLCLEKGLSLFPYTEEMRTRDRQMRDRICELMARHRRARLLHICGWQHLCDPNGIYDALNPTRVFIYDKSVCV